MPQAHSTVGKGKAFKGKRNTQKEKCNCSDDISLEPLQEEVKKLADCLSKLKEHLLCQTHSDMVKRAYCISKQEILSHDR
jgi:hypothetical protein